MARPCCWNRHSLLWAPDPPSLFPQPAAAVALHAMPLGIRGTPQTLRSPLPAVPCACNTRFHPKSRGEEGFCAACSSATCAGRRGHVAQVPARHPALVPAITSHSAHWQDRRLTPPLPPPPAAAPAHASVAKPPRRRPAAACIGARRMPGRRPTGRWRRTGTTIWSLTGASMACGLQRRTAAVWFHYAEPSGAPCMHSPLPTCLQCSAVSSLAHHAAAKLALQAFWLPILWGSTPTIPTHRA